MGRILALLLISSFLFLISLNLHQSSKKIIPVITRISDTLELIGNLTVTYIEYGLKFHRNLIRSSPNFKVYDCQIYKKKFFALLATIIRDLPEDSAAKIYRNYQSMIGNSTEEFLFL